jgi:uncharacterized membrane protein YqjE
MEVNVITLRKIRNALVSFTDEPTHIEMAEIELREAQKRLLETMSALDYAKATVSYHSARIERLEAYLAMNKRALDINAIL